MRRLIAGLLAAVSSAGCVDVASQVRRLEQERRELASTLETKARAATTAQRFAESLARPGDAPAPLMLAYADRELVRLSGQVLPLRLPAKNFHNRLSGDIVVERMTDLRFAPENRAAATLLMRGDGVRYTGAVPDLYKKEVAAFQAGIASGVEVVLDVAVELVGERVRAEAKVRSTRFVAGGGGSFEGLLRDEMNERAFRRPLALDVALDVSPGVPQWVLLTDRQAIVGYDRATAK
jgi:hypothetical protein